MGSTPNIKDPGGTLVRHHRGQQEGSAVDFSDPRMVLLTGAYCPRGCPLIREEGPKFDGFSGIVLNASAPSAGGGLVLSPFQGDSRKISPEFLDGDILSITCPICGTELDPVGPCDCGPDGQYVALYTVPVADPDFLVGICRRWGCFRSFIRDAGRLVTEYRVGIPDEA